MGRYIGLVIYGALKAKKISVTKAAKHLGVGRPALSTMLNGHASLSVEMAIKLEELFFWKDFAQTILHQQVDYDLKEARKTYVSKVIPMTDTNKSSAELIGTRLREW